eukprot:CAMPEP_0204283816 /NCGR_PEP_ID=MMETSP0468-20130131/47078_1 /ASSEMBLY_ACC=CAM_ASM_000383 /TAXON_ID=2969 /ORGANISM="Oxyrrhis marina" /LENGTH=104 /DNA_ID=CAMNT_0051261479 /DNA_START=293 /DNA_END=607 /DNA_ORIENTATION=-
MGADVSSECQPGATACTTTPSGRSEAVPGVLRALPIAHRTPSTAGNWPQDSASPGPAARCKHSSTDMPLYAENIQYSGLAGPTRFLFAEFTTTLAPDRKSNKSP